MRTEAIVFIRENNEQYPFNVQILCNGIYTGYGRYCKNWSEVNEAIEHHNAKIIDVRFES